MDPLLTWQVVLFISFPEAALLTALGLRIIGARPKWYQVICIAISQALTSYVIRSLPIVFGLHTIIMLFTWSVIIFLFYRLEYWKILIACGATMAFYIALESMVLPLVINFMGLTLADILQNPWQRVVVFLPQELIVGVLYLLCTIFNFRLIPLVKKKYDL